MEDFNECIDKCGLLELPVLGRKLSWCNGHEGLTRSWAWLDRTLVNEEVLRDFLEASIKYMSGTSFDHRPMTIKLQKKYALKISGLTEVTKKALKVWNKEIFGRVYNVILELEERVEALDSRLQDAFSKEAEQEYLSSKIELEEWQRREEIRLSQLQIHAEAVKYLQIVLTSEESKIVPDLSHIIESTFFEEEGQMLCALPVEEEVRTTTHSIPMDSAPGPDGYGLAFFIKCWDIIKGDLVEATKELFERRVLPRFYTSSYIVLIPKVENPSSFDKFRPISLCSVVYKIFSKILVQRMSVILSKIISQEKGAFIPSRSIFENITLT
ncbi:uncharacterized protein LOC111374593 [Olea europaea var. sylvestris]|uniref:uncharacterized protein LOC111374593 n=1 Tax=Olea europaea var. sylvestris TaxID=158386 RepID=UPI000C1D1327|nr:uncharacterized protein LOC111374593 [Olea europaea var. sylvestris]